MSVLCLVLKGPAMQEAKRQIDLHRQDIGMLELRLDLWNQWSTQDLKGLRQEMPLPVIYTLKIKENEEEYFHLLQQLVSLKPDYIDLESDLSEALLHRLEQEPDYSQVSFIHSFHHMEEIPEDLDALYRQLSLRCKKEDLIKIAVTPKNTAQSLTFFNWVKNKNKQRPRLIGIAMGEYGILSRVAASHAGSAWSYTYPDEEQAIAPGQISCQMMQKRYRYTSLSSTTGFYGLLGDPVSGSISHWSHNLLFKQLKLDVRYFKMRTTPEELKEVLALAKEMGFLGFSITMPLKEHILPYLDRVEEKALCMGAVNTLRLEGDEWVGYNTDGAGAVAALRVVSPAFLGKTAVILGSGGCARAISHALHQEGCSIQIVSRNQDTGNVLARQVGGKYFHWGHLERVQELSCDFLINAAPIDLDLNPDQLKPSTCVMETKTLPKESRFILTARARGCPVIYGHCMFEEQALLQMKLWFPQFLELFQENTHELLADWRNQISEVLSKYNQNAFLKN